MGEGEDIYALGLFTCTNQFLIGTPQVAWLHFTAIANQSSAFVPLIRDNTVGLQPDGTEVRNFAPQAGRVAVVGEESLLEAAFATNGAVTLHLYGPIGSNNRIEATAQLPSLGTWMPWQDLTLSNLWQAVAITADTNQTLFFRAVRQ